MESTKLQTDEKLEEHGLKTSEHLGNIIVHPTNSNIVYVSAYGRLWSKGEEWREE